jgi:serine/threonine protein kinase
MHKERVVHLNLKPQNILMEGDNNQLQPQINKIRKAREWKGADKIILNAKNIPANR